MVTVDPIPGYPYTPYCGSPPTPGALIMRWNLDPVLILVLIAALAAYCAALGEPKLRRRAPAQWRRACFYAGWATAAFALVSPLCALSVALFSARIGQHLILAAVAAPLIALGRPWAVWAGLVGIRITGRERMRIPGGEIMAAIAFTAALWFWHSPAPYATTFRSGLSYWLMHASVLGTALWLCAALFAAPTERPVGLLAAAAVTTVQMGFLGAAIAFASRPLYEPHALTTAAWGLTPLRDQALGGVLIWIPAGLVLLGAVLAGFALAVLRAEARTFGQASA